MFLYIKKKYIYIYIYVILDVKVKRGCLSVLFCFDEDGIQVFLIKKINKIK